MPVTEDTKPNDNLGGFTNYKQKYSSMKTKLKAILYENELFQDEIRKLQRELLDIYRDKEILLERVIQYEDIDSSDSDSGSQSSDNECDQLELIKQEPQIFVPTSDHCNNQTFVVSNKTDALPANGGGSSTNGSTATKNASTGKPTAASKPKAPSRNRKTNANATKNGSKVTINSSAKSNNGKNQKQQAVAKSANNNNDQKQQQPLTIISGVPISDGQINLVPQITPIETNMGTTLTPSIQQSLTPQANHNMSDQFQQQHQIIQHHQMHLQQQHRHADPQTTIAVDSSQQQQQQRIMTSQWQTQQDLNHQNSSFTSNGSKIGNFVIKTDVQPINVGSNGNSVLKNASTGKATAASKPKAPTRNRSKANASVNKSGSKTNSGTKSNNGKNQKQASKANNNNNNNSNNNNQLQMLQQQPLTVISRIPITSGQVNMVPQIAPIETTMGNKLMPSIQTITTQANLNMSEQFQQQQHQIIQHHQMRHQQSHHHLPDNQTVIGVDSPQQQQQLQQTIITTRWQNQQDLNQQSNAFSTQHLQPIESTMNNNLVPSIQTLTTQSNHTISEHFQQQQQHQQQQHHHQLQMMQHHQMMQQQQQLEHQQQQQQLEHQQQQQQLEQQQQQQQLEQQQQQIQLEQQQQQQQQLEQQQQLQQHIGDSQASVAMRIDNSQQLQQPIITAQWQNQQDLNQQTNTFSTQHLTTEQLSAEELEQHLESRRLEQAALLLPDWESSVPSEIFSTDSAIKFMAED